MRILSLTVLLLSCLSAFSQTKSVLFLGNSYTAVNNLPNLVYQLALSGGDTLIYDSNMPGGYTLGASPNAHNINATSLSKIRAQAWDFVVLQEQSQIPTIDYYRNTTMYPGARQLNDSIHANDPCTKTMFYMTWGRRYGGQQCAGPYCSVAFTDFSHMTDTLASAYMRIANELGAYVSPVGIAWKSVIEDTSIVLHSADDSHPNLTGSYLAACTFYAAIWQKSPVGLPYDAGLGPGLALYLQQKADSVVLSNPFQWNIGADTLHADFSFSVSNDTVVFTNNSVNAIQTRWFFGDGDSTVVTSPTHYYDSAGTFTVSLIVSDGCLTDTISQQVTTELPVGVEAATITGLTVYPNPVSGDEVYLSREILNGEYRLFSLDGRIIVSGKMNGNRVELENLGNGVFVLELWNNGSFAGRMKLVRQE